MDLRSKTIHRRHPKRRPGDREELVSFEIGQSSTVPRPWRQGQRVTARGPCNPSGGAPANPNCYRDGKSICDYQRVSGSLFAQAAGAAWGPLNVVPTNTQYFEPMAMEMVVTENGNPNANSRVRLTAFAIANTPQEPIHTVPALAATAQFIWSDYYLPGDFGPRPVSWGVFSVAALTKPLQIWGWAPAAPAVAVDINVVVYGNAIDNLPPSVGLGQQIPR